jgi:translocator protein
VWTVLYGMMAAAAWLVWRRRGIRGARVALLLYGLQLAANALWSWLFFAWREGAWAFVDIVGLLFLLVATVVAFARCDRLAAALLLPYLGWVGFASVLSFAVWRLNPGLL